MCDAATCRCFAVSRSTFYAAQALQELLSLNGCAPEVLPSVDAVHSAVKYLVPIMEDSGFRAILENTRLSIDVELGKRSLRGEVDADSRSAVMQDASNAKEWVSPIEQMCLSSRLHESLYIQTNVRVAWLATFAVHILGMACKVMYSSATLWEAPGTRGVLTIQFGPPSLLADTSPVSNLLSLQVTAKNTGPSLETTYYLHEAIESELAERPHIPMTFYPCFYRILIYWLGRSVVEILINFGRKCYSLALSGVDEEAAMLRVCRYLGIPV